MDVADSIMGGSNHSSSVDYMDEDDQDLYKLSEVGKENLQSLCKKAAVLFFDEYGLISHQINSYNEFISHGLQNVFDSFGELNIDPGFDPSKKGDRDWRYASVRFGKVTLHKPTFFGGEGNVREFKMLPRHARLQRMTYSSKITVEVHVKVI